jgi:hypothetical protein
MASLLAACGGGGGTQSPTLTAGLPAPSGSSTPTPTPTGGGTPTSAPSSNVAMLGSCRAFPADNPWNADISAAALDPKSAAYLNEMNPSGTIKLHPDFGSDPTYGIPINVVSIPPANFVPIAFTSYASESDPGPYPIPASPKIEAPTDSHMLIVDNANCKLYETFATSGSSGAGWSAANGAVFDLNSNALRPDTWTSADAAGLPIAAGLVRYAEVQAGEIDHAMRFTMPVTSKGYIHPATHQAGSSTANAPPMGLRLRLKASYDISTFHGNSLVILKALKKYGMLLADNGSSFFISGETDTRWDDNDLNQLKTVPASAFEAVYTGPVLP